MFDLTAEDITESANRFFSYLLPPSLPVYLVRRNSAVMQAVAGG
jgi:hypothetical protein